MENFISVKGIIYREVSFEELNSLFRKYGDDMSMGGIIVFDQSNFNKKYTKLGRSYITSSSNKRYNPRMCGNSVFASCLDGSESGVRIDEWLYGANSFKIDRCYIEIVNQDAEGIYGDFDKSEPLFRFYNGISELYSIHISWIDEKLTKALLDKISVKPSHAPEYSMVYTGSEYIIMNMLNNSICNSACSSCYELMYDWLQEVGYPLKDTISFTEYYNNRDLQEAIDRLLIKSYNSIKDSGHGVGLIVEDGYFKFYSVVGINVC